MTISTTAIQHFANNSNCKRRHVGWRYSSLVVLLLIVVNVANAATTTRKEIPNDADWDAVTAGKAIFIQFYTDWCVPSRKLRPVWSKLMAAYRHHPHYLVSRVDCTDAASGSVCHKHQVTRFPTLLYGSTDNVTEYVGNRDLDSLQQFVEGQLQPVCGIHNLASCSDEVSARVDAAQSSFEAVQEARAAISEAQCAHEEQLVALQQAFNKAQAERKALYGVLKGMYETNIQSGETTRVEEDDEEDGGDDKEEDEDKKDDDEDEHEEL